MGCPVIWRKSKPANILFDKISLRFFSKATIVSKRCFWGFFYMIKIFWKNFLIKFICLVYLKWSFSSKNNSFQIMNQFVDMLVVSNIVLDNNWTNINKVLYEEVGKLLNEILWYENMQLKTDTNLVGLSRKTSRLSNWFLFDLDISKLHLNVEQLMTIGRHKFE